MEIERLPHEEYHNLHEVLDDVIVLNLWIQRQILRWVPDGPKNEAMELRYLEGYLDSLARSAELAREKVRWRRENAEACYEDERLARFAEQADRPAPDRQHPWERRGDVSGYDG